MKENILELLDTVIDHQDEMRYRNIMRLIETAINFIGKEVNLEGEVVTLSWGHIEYYLNTWVPNGYDLHGIIDTAFHLLMLKVNSENTEGLYHITFKEAQGQIALAYVDFLKPILILRNTEYPKIINIDVVLKEEQFFFCQRFVINKNGKIVLRDPKSLLNNDMLLKTLRADTFDFSYQFILGIIPGENGKRRLQNIRPSSRLPYVVTPKGTIEKRLSKQPTHTLEEKAGFSQLQSCTLIDKHLLSPAFGFTKSRNAKLYGLMTDSRDALITRLLTKDSGTVSRIFDHDSHESAQKSFSYVYYNNKKDKCFFSRNEIEEFKDKNIDSRKKRESTNELLARLRFNPERSVVAICTDTLESRLLAYDFAQELLEHYADYAKKMGITLNPNFQLPIIFYVEPEGGNKKNNRHDIKLYTADMQQKDQEEALAIYIDINRKTEKYKYNDYDFLLGLPAITLQILLEPVTCLWSYDSKVPLALTMMRNGNVRMLMRLLRLGKKTQPDIRRELVEFIVNNKLLKQNDRAITCLIIDEQFDIANTFIAATQSNINSLPGDYRCNGSRLVDHIQEKGNPRHIKYTGLEQTWLEGQINNWIPITLFIKEHPELPRIFLGQLLHIACKTTEHNAAKFLLKHGAPMHANNSYTNIAPICIAAINKDWEMVTLFCKYKSDADDTCEFGFALFLAISDGQQDLAKQLLQSGAKATWRNNAYHSIEDRLRSTLNLALERGFDELLPQLIEYEKTSVDIHAVFRSEQALKLALARGNFSGVELIQQNFGPITLTNVGHEPPIYQQVLVAFTNGGRTEAKKVLLNYCRQHQLLPTDHDLTIYPREWLISLLQHRFDVKDSVNVVEGLRLILPFFRHEQLINRCVEILIDFVLKNTVETLHPQENFPTQGWRTLLASDDVGKIVVSSILRDLPQSIRDTLERLATIEKTTKTMTMTPISLAAHANEWEIIQRISNYPTDPEDKSEYGYALFMALQNGRIPLARLLLAAGAKPTWRNNSRNSCHFTSTVWVAIDLEFNELLPELIEHENHYRDEESLIRIEIALEHAHHKKNHEAINILQDKWGPITLFDDSNVIRSICQRVLVTLRIEGKVNAKEQLLNYLQQHHLLPNDSDLMVHVQDWIARLFQRHISSYLSIKDNFYDALKLLMPSITPDKIKARCTSALINWIFREPNLSALIANLTCLKDQNTLKIVGDNVIDDLSKSLDKEHRSNLIRNEIDQSKSRGIRPISRAAMEKDWVFVRQFAEHPTDIDDQCEYGYALWAALSAGQEELAEILIRAGAKLTWRNNITHTFEDKLKSTTWAALNSGSNKLLPQLIDNEKNYLDEYTMLRFEHALDRAYEINNHEAINLIQEKVGPITLIDPNNSAVSICRRVLILLSIEGQSPAEKRLLTYCRQHHLLPDEKELTTHAQLWVSGLFQRQLLAKDACLAVEGLRIIMPHLCTVLVSFPTAGIRKLALKKMMQWIMHYKEPTLFGLMTEISQLENQDIRHYFAYIVINTILKYHTFNISLIREIIRLNFSEGFGKEIWKMALDSRCDKIRTRKNWGNKSDDEALLLFEIHPMMPEDFLAKIYDSAIHRYQHKITRAVITRPDLSQKTKRKILEFALCTNLWAKETDRMIPLMMSLNFPVAIKHLVKASHHMDEDLFDQLIDHIDKVKYSKPDYLWEYVNIFNPTFPTDFKREKKLMALVGPSMLRHIILIHWLMEYYKKGDFPNLSRFYHNNELSKKHYCRGLLYNFENQYDTDNNILNALNTYFCDENILPKEDILIETFSIITRQIEPTPNPNEVKAIGFFKKTFFKLTSPRQDENSSYHARHLKEMQERAEKLYRYMHELDQLLRKHEATVENNENAPLPMNASSTVSVSRQ